MMAPAFARLDKRSRVRWMPPPNPRAYGTFVRTLRYPDGPLGPAPGREAQMVNPSTEPAQRLWIEAHDSGRWNKFLHVAPSQRGKSLYAIIAPTLYAIAECGASVAYAMPTLDLLSKTWSGKLVPGITGSGYGAWLPKAGPGSKGGKAAVVTLHNPATGITAGRINFIATGGGGRESSKASVSTRVNVFDEADDARDVAEIELVFRRGAAFGASSRTYVASTVNHIPGRQRHPILDGYQAGTRSRVAHKCPHCGVHAPIQRRQFNVSLAAISCASCGAVWSEADRHQALNDAILVHENPDADIFTYLTVGVDYHWEIPDPSTGKVELLLPKIAAEAKAAEAAELHHDVSLARMHAHKVWCEEYTPPESDGEITNASLSRLSAASTYDKRIVPAWASHLTMATDVQGDRHYWLTLAHGPGSRWAVVDWGYEMLVPKDGPSPERAPTPEDRIRTQDAIDAMANAGWQVEGGETRMVPVQRWIDAGYLPDEIQAWVRGHPRWKAVRGVGHDDVRSKGTGWERTLAAEIRQTACIRCIRHEGWSIHCYQVDGGHFRHAAHAALLRLPDQPASGQLPRGLAKNDALVLHLSGEVWDDSRPGKPGYWREVRKRHDWLDCLIYALAAALYHRHHPDAYDDAQPAAEAAPPAQASPAADLYAPATGGSWVTDY